MNCCHCQHCKSMAFILFIRYELKIEKIRLISTRVIIKITTTISGNMTEKQWRQGQGSVVLMLTSFSCVFRKYVRTSAVDAMMVGSVDCVFILTGSGRRRSAVLSRTALRKFFIYKKFILVFSWYMLCYSHFLLYSTGRTSKILTLILFDRTFARS
jgi:hypothetical protein